MGVMKPWYEVEALLISSAVPSPEPRLRFIAQQIPPRSTSGPTYLNRTAPKFN